MESLELVKKDIEIAKKLMQKELNASSVSCNYSPFFLFSKENQIGVNNVINYMGKTVLTPASSGDQYLGAMYSGAKNVDLFDRNRFTKYITNLKIAAIMTLDYYEFTCFFFPYISSMQNKFFWNTEDFYRVIKILPFNDAFFWSNLMPLIDEKTFGNLFTVSDMGCFMDFEKIVKVGMPFYSNEEEYNKLKSILRKSRNYPRFLEINLKDYDGLLLSKYDIEYLSNIIDGLILDAVRNKIKETGFLEEKTQKEIINSILYKVCINLNRDGVILVDYRANSNKKKSVDYLFNNAYFESFEIPSKDSSSCDTDLILTYKPYEKGLIWNEK